MYTLAMQQADTPFLSEKCKNCGRELKEDSNFCPFCGRSINEKSTKLTGWQQIKIYVGSILLAPFSLYWFFKYFRDPENKVVAYVSLIITLVTFYYVYYTIDAYIKAITSYSGMYGI